MIDVTKYPKGPRFPPFDLVITVSSEADYEALRALFRHSATVPTYLREKGSDSGFNEELLGEIMTVLFDELTKS